MGDVLMIGRRGGKSRNLGAANCNAALSEHDVRLIRALLAERERLLAEAANLTVEKIAAKFDVQPITIQKIRYYQTWRHVR